MKAEAAAASRSSASAASTRSSRHGAFGAVLARARSHPARWASQAAGALVPLRRRRGADDLQRQLGERRDSAEPGRPGATAQPLPADSNQRALDASPRAPLSAVSVIERVAIESGRMTDRPFVELSFGGDLRIRLTRSPRGVELRLEPNPGLCGAARAELPRLVAALRARGVVVAKAEVRASVGSGLSGSRSGACALTPRRGSATTAGALHPGGTIAKW